MSRCAQFRAAARAGADAALDGRCEGRARADGCREGAVEGIARAGGVAYARAPGRMPPDPAALKVERPARPQCDDGIPSVGIAQSHQGVARLVAGEKPRASTARRNIGTKILLIMNPFLASRPPLQYGEAGPRETEYVMPRLMSNLTNGPNGRSVERTARSRSG